MVNVQLTKKEIKQLVLLLDAEFQYNDVDDVDEDKIMKKAHAHLLRALALAKQ